MVFSLFPLQEKVVCKSLQSLKDNNCFAFFDEVRTGKTIMSLELLKILVKDKFLNIEDKVLLVVPTSLVYNWKTEIDKFLKWPCYILNIQKDKFTLKADYTNVNIYIIGIDLLSYHIEKYFILLKREGVSFVILDEAHAIKNYKSKRFKSLRKISLLKNIKGRVVLTATPAKNSVMDIYSLLSFMMPRLFKSYWNMVNKCCVTEQIPIGNGRNARKVVCFNDYGTRLVNRLLKAISSNTQLYDHKFYTNNIIEKKHLLEPTKIQKEYYDKIQEDEIVELPNDDEFDFFNDAPYLSLLTRSIQLAHSSDMFDIPSNIVVWLKKYFEKHSHKVIIVGRFTKYLLFLEKLFGKAFKVISYTGKDNIKKKDEKLNYFIDSDCQVMFANYNTLKEGLNLYMIDSIVFLDLPWTSALFEQCKNRITPPVNANKELMHKKKTIHILEINLPISLWITELVTHKKNVLQEINKYSIIDLIRGTVN